MRDNKFVCAHWLFVLWSLILVVSLQAQSPVEYWVGSITAGEETIIVRLSRSTAFIYQDKTTFAQDLVDQTFVVNELPFIARWDEEQVTVIQAEISSKFSAVVPMLDDPYRFLGYYETSEGQSRFVYHIDALRLAYLEGNTRVTLFSLGDGHFLSHKNESIQFVDDVLQVREGATFIKQNRFTVEEVQFPSGTALLKGTLFRPVSKEPVASVVIAHGSSPNTRWAYQQEAGWFVLSGAAVLIYDKRGAGESTGETETASLQELADDAISAATYLQTRSDIQSNQITIWGVSQGVAVASLAAAKSSAFAYVIGVSGAGYPLRHQEMYRLDQLYRENDYALSKMGWHFWHLAFDLLTETAQGRFPDLGFQDHLGLSLDLAAIWHKVPQPTLLIYGGRDKLVESQTAIANIQAAFSASQHTDYQIVLFPTGNHGILDSGTGGSLEFNDHIADGYILLMATWLADHVTGQATPQQLAPSTTSSPDFGPGGRYTTTAFYQTAAFQIGLLLGMSLVWVWGLVAGFSPLARLTSAMGLLTFGIFLWLIVTVVFSPLAASPVPKWMPLFQLFCVATAAVMAAALIQGVSVYKQGRFNITLQHTLMTIAFFIYVGWLWYWQLLGV